jgi:transcriptional regulator with XRE-family HTH domain
MVTNEALAEVVRETRNLLGETQQVFGERLGASVATIRRYETGDTPKKAVLKKLVKVAHQEGFTKAEFVFRSALADRGEKRMPSRLENLYRSVKSREYDFALLREQQAISEKALEELETFNRAMLAVLTEEIQKSSE